VPVYATAAFSDRGRQLPEQFAGHQYQVLFHRSFGFARRRASEFEHSLLVVNKRKRGMVLDGKEFVWHRNEDPFRHPAQFGRGDQA
jgi:hypothetical protein